MTIVLQSKLCKILLYTARIRYENTYDMHATLSNKCLRNDSRHPCRFAKQILVPLPNAEARADLFTRLFGKHELEFDESDVQAFVQRTEHYSGADIATLVHECSFHPLRKMLAARWFEIEGEDEEDLRVHAYTEPTMNCVESSLEGVMEEYGEDALVLPKVLPEVVFTAISRMRPSVSSEVRYRYVEYLSRVP